MDKTSMTTGVLIERWFAFGLLIFGLSHVLHPARWADVFLPLRASQTGGFILALFYLPLGLALVLGHNVWVWRIPVLVTLAGWGMVLKSVIYLLVPRAISCVMPAGDQMESTLRRVGAASILFGGWLIYASFSQR